MEFNQIIALGMPALLENKETRSAIIEYIKTLTDQARPKEQWREVYYKQSKEVRLDPNENRASLLKNTKCRLLVIGFWDANEGIGNLRAYQFGEFDYSVHRNLYYRDFGQAGGKGDVDNTVFEAKDYMQVIRAGEAWFNDAKEIWYTKTNPLPLSEAAL